MARDMLTSLRSGHVLLLLPAGASMLDAVHAVATVATVVIVAIVATALPVVALPPHHVAAAMMMTVTAATVIATTNVTEATEIGVIGATATVLAAQTTVTV